MTSCVDERGATVVVTRNGHAHLSLSAPSPANSSPRPPTFSPTPTSATPSPSSSRRPTERSGSALRKLCGCKANFWLPVKMEDEPDSASRKENMEDPITASLGPMGRLLRRLNSFEASGHRLPEGLSVNGIRLLKEGLEGLYNYLKKLPDADLHPSFTPKWWIKEVRELGYDTEDFLDEAMQSGGSTIRRSAPRSTFFGIISERNQRLPQIAEEFSHLMARVDDARERCQSFQLAPETPTEPDSGQAGTSHRRRPDLTLPLSAPISDVQVDTGSRSIVGIEEPMKKLVNLLAFGDGNKKQLKVVPIFGSTGIGKTMVARTIYRQYRGEFQSRAFVRVSRNPDMRRLLTCILSQIKAPGDHTFSDSHDLIDRIIRHVQGKRYFIVVDDLWTTSVWDIISRAFPYGDCCSRILTTTQIEDVALACSGYESEYIFRMEPLNDGESRKLFFNTVFGSEGEGGYPKEFKVVADGIIRKCGGLPLLTLNVASLLLPSKPNPAIQQWEEVESSLPSSLRTDPTSQGMKDVLMLIYNMLPLHLKTCLLYVSMYPEGYTIRKDDLVKQWVAESFFVGGIEDDYFDELVRRGMIQPVETNYHGEVLSCTVNHMVLDLIRYKSMEDNFITTVNYLESTLGLPDKARRLSVQFGGAKGAKIPVSIRMSRVRSLLFFGFSGCVPFVRDFGLLQVLILHIWADQDKRSFDLTGIGELFRLRYIKIECNITVNLPDKIQGLRYLETLQVDGRLSAVPSDIGHLEKLRHLRLRSQSNVRNLGELVNLHDLHLTCSTVQPADNLEDSMKYLGSILEKLGNLKSVILTSASSCPVNTSRFSISCDGLSNVSPVSAHLERLELLPRICIFPGLPEWFKMLAKLCSLKIAVREFLNSDADIMKGLPALTDLSLYIQIAPAERVIFGKAGFSALKYFKVRCNEPLLRFEAGAMPNLQNLKLVFNAQDVQQHGAAPICIEHLAGLREISAKIWGSGAADTQSALRISISNDPKNPKINDQLVNWKFYAGEEDGIMATQEDAGSIKDELGEILEENTEYEYKGEDENRQPDSGISAFLESSTASPSRTPDRRYGRRRTTLKSADEGRDGLLFWHHCLPCIAGSSRKYRSKLTASSSRAFSASMLPSAKSECKILQSGNVKDFSYNDLRLATQNFCPETLLGKGRFGSVYKGWIDEHTLSACQPHTRITVAVKTFNQEVLQRHQDWLDVVNYLGKVCHPNLVKLIGYCLEDEYRLLVYEYMPRGSLEYHLFRKSSHFQPLPWNLRMKVALGAAKGLAYLHSEEATFTFIDFKTSCILLDTDYTAKLTDYGLANDGPVGEDSHVSTRVMGTYGAPEYLSTGYLLKKSSIFSFGVVLLELLSGLRVIDENRPQGERNLVTWARPYLTDKRKMHLVMDAALEGQYPLNGLRTIAALAVNCLYLEAKMRPSMDGVVSILEGVQDSSDPGIKLAAWRHQKPKGAGKKMTSESVGRKSGKHRLKSSGDLRKEAGREL